MPEGLRIYSLIDAKDVNELKMGQKAQLGTLEIKKDEGGNTVVAYCFVPVG